MNLSLADPKLNIMSNNNQKVLNEEIEKILVNTYSNQNEAVVFSNMSLNNELIFMHR